MQCLSPHGSTLVLIAGLDFSQLHFLSQGKKHSVSHGHCACVRCMLSSYVSMHTCLAHTSILCIYECFVHDWCISCMDAYTFSCVHAIHIFVRAYITCMRRALIHALSCLHGFARMQIRTGQNTPQLAPCHAFLHATW
jgi:hypothetical protein